MHKINSKAKSIARASYKKTESAALNTLHSDIKRLAYLVYYTNNKNAKNVFATEIIPNLVRIDMSLFDEEEISAITPDFLKKLGKEQKGQICTTNLKEIYALYIKRRLRQ